MDAYSWISNFPFDRGSSRYIEQRRAPAIHQFFECVLNGTCCSLGDLLDRTTTSRLDIRDDGMALVRNDQWTPKRLHNRRFPAFLLTEQYRFAEGPVTGKEPANDLVFECVLNGTCCSRRRLLDKPITSRLDLRIDGIALDKLTYDDSAASRQCSS